MRREGEGKVEDDQEDQEMGGEGGQRRGMERREGKTYLHTPSLLPYDALCPLRTLLGKRPSSDVVS